MSSGFITESQVAEKKRVRQENWENTRNEDDPLEAPEEEEYDPRSLYDRLQEQKDKKQEDYDEIHKFKNMVRGLEDDEVDFLDLVDRTKLREEKKIKTEDSSAMAEYRKKVSAMQKKAAEEDMRAEMRASESRKPAGEKKTSQLSLLAGAIKRKSISEEKSPEEIDAKKHKTESNALAPANGVVVRGSSLQCIGVLPGLGQYTDSDDSDNPQDTDSDSEECIPQTSSLPRDITGRMVKPPSQCSGGQSQGGGGGGGCC